jgi:RNA polymerase sigma-70 factor, ECF subfamily
MTLTPTPVVALNRAVAVAELDGPATALTIVDGLALDSFYMWHAIRADLLTRLGRGNEAITEYETAASLTNNSTQQRFLHQQRLRVSPGR